jgi:hypothetical protein
MWKLSAYPPKSGVIGRKIPLILPFYTDRPYPSAHPSAQYAVSGHPIQSTLKWTNSRFNLRDRKNHHDD